MGAVAALAFAWSSRAPAPRLLPRTVEDPAALAVPSSRPLAPEQQEPPPPRPLSAVELWRVELPGLSVRRSARRPGGGFAVGGELRGETRVGGTYHTTRGEEDILLLGLSDGGEILDVLQVGGRGSDSLDDMTSSERATYLAVRSDGPLTLGTRTVAPPKASEDALSVPEVAAVVTVTAGAPPRLLPLPGDPREVALAAIPTSDGEDDLVVATSFTGDGRLFGHAELRRLAPTGAVRWERRVEGVEVNGVHRDGETLAVSVRADSALALWVLNPETGEPTTKHTVTKLPGTGDLGTIAGGLVGDGLDVVFGETGGDVLVDGARRPRPSYSIQPFMLIGQTGGDTTFTDIADVTGWITGTGRLRRARAAVVSVLHTGSDPTLLRGAYVAVVRDTETTLVPLSQVRYANDDWEHEPPEPVLGDPLHPTHATFAGDTVLVVGSSDPDGRHACVVAARIEGL